MFYTYNVITGMNFYFDSSEYYKGEIKLPYKKSILESTVEQINSNAKGFIARVVKKKNTTVWELNVKTGKLIEAEMIANKHGGVDVIRRKNCDYFQALNRETAEAKARKLFLHKY